MVKSNEVSLKDAIEQMLHAYKLKGKIYEAQLSQMWGNIVGKMIENHTHDLYLKNGKLYVKLDSAVLKQELSYSRTKIKDQVNQALGGNVVEEVVLL